VRGREADSEETCLGICIFRGKGFSKELKQLVKILKVLKGFTFIACSSHLHFLLAFLPRTISSFISSGEILKGLLEI